MLGEKIRFEGVVWLDMFLVSTAFSIQEVIYMSTLSSSGHELYFFFRSALNTFCLSSQTFFLAIFRLSLVWPSVTG